MAGIAGNWRKLSGEDNWEGLLDPLDIDLRRYIIHCGERVEAVGDAYNGDTASKQCRFPRYPPNDFFSMVGLQNGNPFKYKVTNYFYARVELELFVWVIGGESSWMGYVAVATDEGKDVLGRRDILICWRGTRTAMEWFKDADFSLSSASDVLGNADDPKVHSGFHSLYTAKSSDSVYGKTSAREQILSEVRKLVDKYQDEEISITVTGHSLGAALATLNAVDIVANGYNKPTNQPNKACLVTVMAFAGPRVGDKGFKKVCDNKNDLHILRISNIPDVVPDLPSLEVGYVDVGEQLVINSAKSPYLNANASSHNLELYLHVVAGTEGACGDFKLAVPRCISLVNKDMDGLKPEYKVPVNWWVEKNKNMVQEDDGSWVLDDNYVPDPPSATGELIPL